MILTHRGIPLPARSTWRHTYFKSESTANAGLSVYVEFFLLANFDSPSFGNLLIGRLFIN